MLKKGLTLREIKNKIITLLEKFEFTVVNLARLRSYKEDFER
jgi:hypothetical protein